MQEKMPPKLNYILNRPSITSAARASITDEKRRQDEVAMNRNISESVPGKTVKDEVQVTGSCQKNQNNKELQKQDVDIDKDGCTADNDDDEVTATQARCYKRNVDHYEKSIRSKPLQDEQQNGMQVIMPPKLNNSVKRHTFTSALRAFITEEKRRQDMIAMNRNISDNVPRKTITDGIPVTGRCQKNQNNNALQKLDVDIDYHGCTADNKDEKLTATQARCYNGNVDHYKKKIRSKPLPDEQQDRMQVIMPQKNKSVIRHTITSAVRASILDEKRRQDMVVMNRNISDSVPGKTTTDEIQVTSRCQKNRNNKALQNLNFDIDQDGCTADNEDGELTGARAKCYQDNVDFYKNRIRSKPLPERSPNYDTRPTITSAARASLIDEKRRQDMVAMNRNISDSVPGKTTTDGILVTGTDDNVDDELTAARAKCYQDNVDFYKNRIRSRPLPGHMIEDMLKWKGNYEMLEKNQNYIQWLFPVPDNNSINTNAQQLFEHEAKLIREDDGAQRRVLKAFMMMLDFYGMKLKDSKHGLVTRADIGWQDRYDHLNRSRHNLSRITRILKSLGELGYERYQARWVEFIIDEAKIKGLLPNLNGPCLIHWVITVKDDREREMLYRKAVGSDIDENDAQSVWKSEGGRNENGDDLKTERTNLSIETNLSSKVKHGKAVTEKKVDLRRKMCESKATYSHIDTSVDSKTSSLSSKLQIVKPLLGAKPSMERPNKQQVTDDYEKGSDEVSLNDKETYQYHNQEREASDNLKFYQNKTHSRPNPGYTIVTMLHCKGDHLFFEMYPGFIHWLFPIPSSVGDNPWAQVLYRHEAKAIREDSVLSSRVYKAFNVVLEFYGMELYNDIKVEFRRNKSTYKDRYHYLQSYPFESYRRITRVLVSIGELGLERFQVPWIEFLIREGIDNAYFPTLDGESIMHWIAAIKDEEERQAMLRKYQTLAGHRPLVSPKETRNVGNNYDVYDTDDTNLSDRNNITWHYAEAEGGFDFLKFM